MTASVYFDEGEDFDSNTEEQNCLLDVMSVKLTEMDLYSAKRVAGKPSQYLSGGHLMFNGYYLLKDSNRPLRDRWVHVACLYLVCLYFGVAVYLSNIDMIDC